MNNTIVKFTVVSNFYCRPFVSPECTDLLRRMLDKDLDERPRMDELWNKEWITKEGPLIDRCQDIIELTEDDVKNSVTTVSKLNTLIMVKQMLKRHSFKNPFVLQKIQESSTG